MIILVSFDFCFWSSFLSPVAQNWFFLGRQNSCFRVTWKTLKVGFGGIWSFVRNLQSDWIRSVRNGAFCVASVSTSPEWDLPGISENWGSFFYLYLFIFVHSQPYHLESVLRPFNSMVNIFCTVRWYKCIPFLNVKNRQERYVVFTNCEIQFFSLPNKISKRTVHSWILPLWKNLAVPEG